MIVSSVDLRAPRAFVALAIGLAGGALASGLVTRFAGHESTQGAGVELIWGAALCTALSCVAATGWVIRSGAVARDRGIVGRYAAAGVLDGGLMLFTAGAFMGEPNLWFVLLGSLAGLLTVPLGAAFAVGCLPVLRAWERLRRNPSHAGRIALFVGVGGWLTGAGLLAGTLATEPLTAALGGACIVVGVVAILGAAAVHVGRVRWLSRVASRRVVGWAICDVHDVVVPNGLARWSAQPDPAGHRPSVLCRVIGGSGDAYRVGDHFEPRLRLPASLLG